MPPSPSIERRSSTYRVGTARPPLALCADCAGCDAIWELAHDVVQDAFATAVRERDQYREEGPLEVWVWRIVINKARLKAPEQVTLPLDVVCRPDSNGSRDDVVAAVAALPERQRLVVFLRYYADLDYRSIAEARTIEVGTVSATLHQAHAALRRSLSEVENEL